MPNSSACRSITGAPRLNALVTKLVDGTRAASSLPRGEFGSKEHSLVFENTGVIYQEICPELKSYFQVNGIQLSTWPARERSPFDFKTNVLRGTVVHGSHVYFFHVHGHGRIRWNSESDPATTGGIAMGSDADGARVLRLSMADINKAKPCVTDGNGWHIVLLVYDDRRAPNAPTIDQPQTHTCAKPG